MRINIQVQGKKSRAPERFERTNLRNVIQRTTELKSLKLAELVSVMRI